MTDPTPTNGKVDCKLIDYVEREQKRLLLWGVLLFVGFLGFLALNQVKALALPGDQFGAITAAFILWIKDVTSNLKGTFKTLSNAKEKP